MKWSSDYSTAPVVFFSHAHDGRGRVSVGWKGFSSQSNRKDHTACSYVSLYLRPTCTVTAFLGSLVLSPWH